MTVNPVFAHSVENRPETEWETLEAHARRVAAAARRRADPFGAGDLAAALGLLHDHGKAKPAFQDKLRGTSADVPHSGEGARTFMGLVPMGRALAAAVAGHHGRLPDPDRLADRIRTAQDLALPDWCGLPSLSPTVHLEHGTANSFPYRLQFLVRMLYGALTDADDRETGAFYAEAEGRSVPDRADVITDAMRGTFDAHMATFGGGGPVNGLRREVLRHARAMAAADPGLFTLTVPTGGGKTLTSLGFALDHALCHDMRRLIYVIPYTSIVEQTADAFREVFGSLNDVVLEHHANADWDGEDESEAEQRKVMGASWDVPIVVTTAVQFFESLHAARKKRCRKLPSLACSVVVLDEAQTLPLPLLRPCLAALRELIEGYGASVVLSTATQPALTKAGGFPGCEALEGAREIAPDPPDLFARLRRVEVRDVGPMDDDALAERMRGADQALLIVDNRMQARALFDALRGTPGAAHLSTLMVPDHRRAVLAEVRRRLKAGGPVRLVSTSLIEAGVDVDFPLVLRAAAGIDSVAQAAGRCNREGRMEGLGRVEVFRSEHDAPPAVEQFATIGRAVLAEDHNDPIGEAAVASYFRRLWATYGADALDAVEVGDAVRHAGILAAIETWGPTCHFETLEHAFRVIPDGQPALAVVGGRWGVDPKALEQLRHGSPGPIARLLRPHTASVPFPLWRRLRDAGLVEWWARDRFDEQFAILVGTDHYDDAAGIRTDALDGLENGIL